MIGNKTVVYTSGTFDMLHFNHLKMIEYARALGDILIVGVNTDELVDHTDKVDKLHFDIFVVGDDWAGKYDYLKKQGVDVVYFPYGDGVSSTNLKKKIYNNYKKLQQKVDNHLPADIEIRK